MTREQEVTQGRERAVVVIRELEVTQGRERAVVVTRELEVTQGRERTVVVTRELEVTQGRERAVVVTWVKACQQLTVQEGGEACIHETLRSLMIVPFPVLQKLPGVVTNSQTEPRSTSSALWSVTRCLTTLCVRVAPTLTSSMRVTSSVHAHVFMGGIVRTSAETS